MYVLSINFILSFSEYRQVSLGAVSRRVKTRVKGMSLTGFGQYQISNIQVESSENCCLKSIVMPLKPRARTFKIRLLSKILKIVRLELTTVLLSCHCQTWNES